MASFNLITYIDPVYFGKLLSSLTYSDCTHLDWMRQLCTFTPVWIDYNLACILHINLIIWFIGQQSYMPLRSTKMMRPESMPNPGIATSWYAAISLSPPTSFVPMRDQTHWWNTSTVQEGDATINQQARPSTQPLETKYQLQYCTKRKRS